MHRSGIRTTFTSRYASVFGKGSAALLTLTGLDEPEYRGEGAWVFTASGRKWLDFGSFGIHLLGHLHPVTTSAALHQLQNLGLSTKILGNEASMLLAEALVRSTPASLNSVVLGNSGAEMVDAAMKMAMMATGRSAFAALRGAYHGRTMGAISLSQFIFSKSPITPFLDVSFVDPHDLRTLEERLGRRNIAALFVEPVQGEGGIRPIPQETLKAIGELCRSTGTLFVLDEIQCGLGRCGRVWRSACDAVPDILLAGKTMGGGLVPLSAAVFSRDTVGKAASDPLSYASSFAGGALACSIGRAVLSVVTNETFLSEVETKGKSFRKKLVTSLGNTPGVIDVRGEGLMIGIELKNAALSGYTIKEAAARGLLISFCLSQPSILRVYPPATVEEADLKLASEILAQSVRAAVLISEQGQM